MQSLLLDGTLLGLARRLRLQGYDAEAITSTDPLIVLRAARPSGRLVLTRDRSVARQSGFEVLLIDSADEAIQLTQIQAAIGRPPDDAPTRCPFCNMPLTPLGREAVRGRVPPYVWRTAERFSHCEMCRRVYWPGTHRAQENT